MFAGTEDQNSFIIRTPISTLWLCCLNNPDLMYTPLYKFELQQIIKRPFYEDLELFMI